MGLSLGKIAGFAAGGIGGAILGDKLLGGGGGPGDPAIGIDPRLKEIADEERKTAEDYESHADDYRKELTEQNNAKTRRDLATQLRANATNASSRGLLNSGIRAGADASARGAAATQAATGAQAANEKVAQTRDQLGYDASNAAMRMYGIQADTAASNYGLAMQRMQQNQAGLASLGKGVGALAGYMAAKPSTPTAPAVKSSPWAGSDTSGMGAMYA